MLCIPRSFALLVIILAKLLSVFPIASPKTTAESFADLTIKLSTASFTVIVFPAFKPSFVRGLEAANFEIGSCVLNVSLPLLIASKAI